MALTASRVDLQVLDSGSFVDAFQFGTPGDTSWSFTGVTFNMDVKGSADDVSPLLSMSSGNGMIVVDDAVNRILHFNVSWSALEAALVPGCYVYDLIMIDGSTPAVRTPLMGGKLEIRHGVTQE